MRSTGQPPENGDYRLEVWVEGVKLRLVGVGLHCRNLPQRVAIEQRRKVLI